MHWQESKKEQAFEISDDVLDLSFRTQGKTLPLDHAQALSDAIIRKLPWLRDEDQAAIHQIHVAESGNGWQRPDNVAHDSLYLSRRTRLKLRLPRHRIDQARQLTGTTLDIAGHRLIVGEAAIKQLVPLATVFSRYVVSRQHDEDDFLSDCVDLLRKMGIEVNKIMCGLPHKIQTHNQPIRVRSLMLADLEPGDSISLQQHGLGSHRLLGCGLFLPHKGIKPVNPNSNE